MYKIGNKVDVYDEDYTESWHVCTVVDSKEDTVKIHYDGYDDQFQEWIPLSSTRIAASNTHTLKYTDYKNPPDLSFGYPAPLFYHDRYHHKEYIIVAPSHQDKHIYAFDLTDSKWFKYCCYHNDVTPIWHAAAIDTKHDKLYIISGANCDFCVLDLHTKQWIINDTLVPLMVACRSLYIGGLFDEVHVYGDGNTTTHFKYNKYDMLQPIEVLPGIDENKTLTNSAMIYVDIHKRLMMFGGWNGIFLEAECYDDIWCCDLHEYCHNDYEWNLYPLKMPQKEKHFSCVHAFDALVFVFYTRADLDKSIWCLDLVSETWYKSDKTFPSNYGASDVVKTKDNDVHFLCCNWSNAPYHIKLCLYDVIPLELNELYKKKYVKIVTCFVRNMFDEMWDGIVIPSSLIAIIVLFVPYFGF